MLLPASPARHAVADVIRIPEGATARDIGMLLEEQGIIRRAEYFERFATLLGVQDKLKAGHYELSPGMNLLTVLAHLQRGEVATVRVTVPEGLNVREISALLADRGLVDRETFLELALHGRDVVADLLPFPLPIESLEGYLYPDTYFFPSYIGEEEIIRRMVVRFLQTAYPLIEEAERQGTARLSPHELVTLASIVEKEAMVDRERPLIAGVFYNRLAVGQRLQSDPTVQYVMARPRARLYSQDLAIDSPYNTYRYGGLPPGPIASPGLRSIRAVLEPEDTPYMYFVARGDGTHVFSRTFQEHVQARRRLGR